MGGSCAYFADSRRPALSLGQIRYHEAPNYKYLSDADPRNAFDIEKYLSTKLKPKPDDVFDA